MIRPLNGNIAVVEIKTERTAGGLYLPDSNKPAIVRGEVVAVGRGRVIDGVLVPSEVYVGAVVFYNKHDGIEISADGESFTVINEDYVIGIVE